MKQTFKEKVAYAHFPPTRAYRFEFDPEKCTGCGMCARTCPTSCIQWDKDKKRPHATGLRDLKLACIGCNNCESVCPAGCIRVRGEYRVLEGRYKTPEDRFGDMTPVSPLNGSQPSPDFEQIARELTETEKVIYKRRSIRVYKKKPVPREMITRIIEAARFAPSAGNGQPWKFIVVTNRELSDRIDRKCAKVLDKIKWVYAGNGGWWRKAAVTLMSLLQVSKWDQRPISAMNKVGQTGGRITFNAPVVIHLLKDTRGISHPDVDVALAAQNLVLAAHSLGLGTCYIGFIASTIKYVPVVKKWLGIEYPYELVTSICVGYPKVQQDKPVPRGKVPVEWID
ncbi:nitroreductase [Desulfonema ishimotonii]|uniref:Nitroreductase n=1 Tax=Desulfonema ishimotonii TaxID=45657 RepID=A0A401FY52_9BACT|nr:nitroreductase family protein [Desulfonema ishimotonii]GBC61864.1 nitroreductase [Desulfonema ishimotonii]